MPETFLTPAGEEERLMAVAFAARVKKLRRQRNLSQERLAETTGLSTSSIQRFESSAARISLSQIKRFHDALHVSYNELLDDLPPATEKYSVANRRRRRLAQSD